MNHDAAVPVIRVAINQNIKRFILGAALALFGTSAAVALPIAGLWNTGVDGAGSPNPVGTPESHYSVATSFVLPVGYSFMTVNTNSLWASAPTDARWIGPSMSVLDDGLLSDPVGTYFYDLYFNLDSFSNATISGLFACDNACRVLLNGVEFASLGLEEFDELHPFSTVNSSLFNVGLNTLRFEVENAPGSVPSGNPSGLIVSGLSGETNYTASVPEPGTLALFGLGLAGLGFARRRKTA